ncbi:MAG: tRNA (adenosine(37)-N6)-dimethylallyltransferase MiaA [Patescibacteria group bacterium]
MPKQKIIIILGQTATGKSALAVKLAKKFNGVVISADSRQVYRGLNLGTGKITKKEMKGIPHYMLDVANPKTQYSVALYQRAVLDHIRYIVARGRIPIICGGTGLYIDTVINGIVLPEVKPNLKLRRRLNNKTAKELFLVLKKLDPRRAKTIDRQNPRRLIRAIEIATALGYVPHLEASLPSYDILKIGLTLPNSLLKKKIRVRLFARIRLGMVAEAKRLYKQGVSWKRMEELGMEYKFLAYYLQKKITKKEMLAKIEKETWQYAKRQRTWFKPDERIVWFPLQQKKNIEKLVRKFFRT